MSQYRKNKLAGLLHRGAMILVTALACGCTNLATGTGDDAQAADDNGSAAQESGPADTEGARSAEQPADQPTGQSHENSAEANDSPAAEPSPVDGYIEFMKQAAVTDGQTRQQMRREIYRRSEEAPLTSRLQLGLLLTSPMETEQHAREGERILREILAGESGLHERVRDLIELRLQEVAVRQALRVELGEAKGKIEDLLSIESSMEEKQGEPRSRSR